MMLARPAKATGGHLPVALVVVPYWCIAGIEFLLIDERTDVNDFRDKLRLNDLYYAVAKWL